MTKKNKVLVTGGCGYIGSHTIVDLINHGFDVISIDNNSRSHASTLTGVHKITGQAVQNYCVDLTDLEATREVFKAHPDIKGIIHFAAFKSVPESVAEPILYYKNNINSLLNVIECTREFSIPYFVFSSSCSVYGDVEDLPVDEETPLLKAACPYAYTKQVGEQMLEDMAKLDGTVYIALRYFNPVGAHTSALIGETPFDAPNNLIPIITQTAIGKRDKLTIFGSDYETRDGTCIRDYIHVMDIANAHTKAFEYALAQKNSSNFEIFNLGTGTGTTVLEAIHAFEKVSKQSLNYEMGDRREGDVEKIYADNKKAQEQLGWKTEYDVEEMMRTAWQWEQAMAEAVVK